MALKRHTIKTINTETLYESYMQSSLITGILQKLSYPSFKEELNTHLSDCDTVLYVDTYYREVQSMAIVKVTNYQAHVLTVFSKDTASFERCLKRLHTEFRRQPNTHCLTLKLTPKDPTIARVLKNQKYLFTQVNRDTVKASKVLYTTQSVLEHLKEALINANRLTDRSYTFQGDINPKYHDYYVNTIEDNIVGNALNCLIKKQIESGSGNELSRGKDKNTPPKMHAIRSSTALAYNVFESINYHTFKWFNCTFETYQLEKKLPALSSRAPANIDVFLASKNTHVYIESKFLENYDIKQYKISESYVTKQPKDPQPKHLLKLFHAYAEKDLNGQLMPPKKVWDKQSKTHRFYYAMTFNFYDGPQMLKHLLGIYHHLVQEENQHITTVYLVNLMWQSPFKNHQGMTELIKQEIHELNLYQRMIDAFKEDIKPRNVELDIVLLSYQDFYQNHEPSFKPEHKAYLKTRYYLD